MTLKNRNHQVESLRLKHHNIASCPPVPVLPSPAEQKSYPPAKGRNTKAHEHRYHVLVLQPLQEFGTRVLYPRPNPRSAKRLLLFCTLDHVHLGPSFATNILGMF